MPEVRPTRTIPQLSQLEIKFAAPLWSDMMVQTKADLQNIPDTYLFYGKLVWVKDELSWFTYIRTQSSTDKIEKIWEPQASRSSITVYDPAKTYLKGDTVYINGKIFTAQKTINPGESPEMTWADDRWMCISGVTIVKSYQFVKMSEFRVAVDINLPFFECWVNEDPDDETSPSYKVEPSMQLITDPDTGVDEYLFRFFKNSEPFEMTGRITCK